MKIPANHQAMMPYLILNDAFGFKQFVENVFSAKTLVENKNPDGTAGHCEIQIEGSTIMFSSSTAQWPQRTADFFIYVEDADQTFRMAKDQGASVIMELTDLPYGRSGGVKDPGGNIWWVTSAK